jgi:hypothetical protein
MKKGKIAKRSRFRESGPMRVEISKNDGIDL